MKSRDKDKCLRGGRQLSDSIVSLVSALHPTAHSATVPPSPIPPLPGPRPGRGFRVHSCQDGAIFVGVQEDEERGSGPSPTPKTLSWTVLSLRGWAQHQDKGVEVSAEAMRWLD